MLAGPLLSRAGGARSMPPNPAQKVPQVGHRDPPGPHSRDVNSCPRERQGGYKQIPPDLPGGYRPPGRLLLQLQRLSSVAGFRLTPKGRWCMYVVCMYLCMYVCMYVCNMYVCMYVCMCVCMYGHTYSKIMGQPSKVANPARGLLSRENNYFPVCVRA